MHGNETMLTSTNNRKISNRVRFSPVFARFGTSRTKSLEGSSICPNETLQDAGSISYLPLVRLVREKFTEGVGKLFSSQPSFSEVGLLGKAYPTPEVNFSRTNRKQAVSNGIIS